MNVLTLGLNWFGQSPGGLDRYVYDYTASLRRRGESVTVMVRDLDQNGSAPPSFYRMLKTPRSPLSAASIWREALSAEVATNRYDILNPHFAYYAHLARLRRFDLPMLTHFHGPWAYESLIESAGRNPLVSRARFILQKAIEKRVYKHSDRFVVLSESFRNELSSRYQVDPSRISVIPGAVDVERFQPTSDREAVRHRLGLPAGKTILLAVRRLVRRMGIDRLMEAFDELRLEFPDLLLVIVGGGALQQELLDYIRSRGLQDFVRFAGRVPDDLLPSYYQAANLTVVPSVDLEGFGLITLESMACGTPVVGTPVGGTEEVLRKYDRRLLFEGTSPRQIRDGLAKWVGATDELPGAQQNRHHVLQNYTWDVVTNQILALMKGMV